MRKATFAKLSLTAAVGIGTLVGQATIAHAGPPKQAEVLILDQSGDTIDDYAPAPTTTIPHFQGEIVNPNQPDADPPFDPDLPIAQPEDDCPQPKCDAAPAPQDPQGECNPNVLCDELTSDDCTWTHGCPQPDPECPPIVLCDELTSDPGCTITHGECDGDDEGTDGGDEGTDEGGDEGTDDGGDEGTDGGTDGTNDEGGTGGGSLPRTGAEMATWAVAGLGLTGVGAALKKLSKRHS